MILLGYYFMPNIAKNTSYFTIALILQKIISLSYFTLYARALGPADLGQYYFAISVTSIFAIFIDFGLGNVITREIAKFPDKARAIISSVVAVKLPLAILTTLLVIGWSNIWGYSELTKTLIYISIISMVLDSFTGAFYALARGFHNLKFESIASIIFQVIVLVFILFILNIGLGIKYLFITLSIASLFNFIFSLSIIRSKWKITPLPNWDKDLIKKLFLIALPFGLYVIVQRFYTYFDSVLLFKLAGDRAVGLYQIPFKIIMALQFLPMALVAALYPALSSYWQNSKEKLALAFEQAITYCLIIAVPVSFGAVVLAEKIVLLFKEQFTEAGGLLRISMLAVPFMFLGFPVGALLNACDKQKRHTINMTITALVSAGLNLILIPHLGVIGACFTTLITSILMLVLGWVVIPKIMQFHWRKNLAVAGRIILAGLVMAISAFFIKNHLNPIITIVLAAVIYIILLFILGSLKIKDLMMVINSFKDKEVTSD